MVKELEDFLATHEHGAYGREAFDHYCAKRKLSLSCPVIHITGSNGKGSTAHYLESIYIKAGYKVAAFIKPAFYSVNETIRFQGEQISDEDLASLYKEHRKDIERFGLTSFEATVVLAYRYFNEKKPDIAIIEAGMGGVIDATNLEDLDTRLAIITTVSLEHTAYLGSTAPQIALHKAGIIKPEAPVLVGKRDDVCLNTIREEAKRFHCPVQVVGSYHFDHLVGGTFHFDYLAHKDVCLPTNAEYQIRNATLAIAAVDLLQEQFPVSEEALREGLNVAPLPGRLETLGRIVLDGAHNPEAIENLCRCLQSASKGRKIRALFASFRDKNIAVELPTLDNYVSGITLTTFDHPRARQEDDYFLYVEDHPFVANPKQALTALLENNPDDVILITGSLAFVGYMRQIVVTEGFDKR